MSCENIGESFNPRAPHGARRLAADRQRASNRVSIHAPRTGRDQVDVVVERLIAVSIHAPRTGRDLQTFRTSNSASRFQSTRPARGATGYP